METTQVQVQVSPQRVEALYAALLRGDPLVILDVRNREAFARWKIEGRASLEVLNIPYFEFLEDEEAAIAQVPAGREVLVVCAKEGSSQYVAELLREREIAASYLEGGIASWGNFYDVRPVVEASWGSLVQVARPARGDLSWLLLSEGEAAIIDPLRHTATYEALVDAAGARLRYLLDTHAHADHISGGPALAASTGASYHLHPYDAIHPIDMLPARLAYDPLQDGQEFVLGQVTIKSIWFPGHTLGQVNYLLTTPTGTYLFTGDGLFLRSFGRPDLGGQGEAWTPLLYESLFERLPAHVTDETVILPAHFSALEEGDAAGRFVAPYREVRAGNDALQPRSREDFTRYVLAHLPHFPPEYVEIKRVNAGLRVPSEEEASELELGKNICALSGN